MPFCHVHCRGQKPPNPAYPQELRTLGDHIRQRRLDLRLTQRQAAARIGGGEAALYNWERGRAAPALWFYPGILAFLGYDPRPVAQTVGEQLRFYRQQRGMSREVLAHVLGVDEGTLARWELGPREPKGRLAERVRRFLCAAGLV